MRRHASKRPAHRGHARRARCPGSACRAVGPGCPRRAGGTVRPEGPGSAGSAERPERAGHKVGNSFRDEGAPDRTGPGRRCALAGRKEAEMDLGARIAAMVEGTSYEDLPEDIWAES